MAFDLLLGCHERTGNGRSGHALTKTYRDAPRFCQCDAPISGQAQTLIEEGVYNQGHEANAYMRHNPSLCEVEHGTHVQRPHSYLWRLRSIGVLLEFDMSSDRVQLEK